ncbi:hypothetical protein [Parendozoicomonas haliclonae]|uniref:hypothetical protein n=1 Tax=Parendozoicomonas haliclonae TaxID=1960125 RepID=UPI001055174D|nr:hypothetical protein [Parendozoicomonas haliclonae]
MKNRKADHWRFGACLALMCCLTGCLASLTQASISSNEDAPTLVCSVASTIVEARRLTSAPTLNSTEEQPDTEAPFQSILMVIKDGWGNYLPPDDPDWVNQLSDCNNLECLKSFIQEETGQFMRCSQTTFPGYENLRNWLNHRKLYSGEHTLLFIDSRLRVIRFDDKNTLIFSRFGRRDAARSIQALGLEETSRTLWLGDIRQPGVLAIVPFKGLDQFIYPHQPVEQSAPASPRGAGSGNLYDIHPDLNPDSPQLLATGQHTQVPEALAPVVTHVANGVFAGALGHWLLRPSRSRNIIVRTLLNRSLSTHMLMGGILFGATGYLLWQGVNRLDKQVPEWGAVTMAGWRLTTGTAYSLGSILADQLQSKGMPLLQSRLQNVLQTSQRQNNSINRKEEQIPTKN